MSRRSLSAFALLVPAVAAAAGTYRFVVRNRSAMHNWHIAGLGVNEQTRVSFQGTKRFTLRLSAGRFTIQCDPHPLQMNTRPRVAAGR